MLAMWGKRRGAAVVLAAGLAAAVLAAVLAAVATARPLDFVHVRTNLSRAASRVSAYPDLAVSPDGDRVVVVWTEGYTAGVGYRGHVYLRAASETGGWGDKVAVFYGSDSASAYDAAVAVAGTAPYTAHVAYVVFEFDAYGSPTQTEVRYKKCRLGPPQVECDATGDTVAAVDALLNSITWVDLALDESGNPHVVWAQYGADVDGDIRYRAYDGSAWGDVEGVWLTGDNHKPVVAWADGYVHAVWEDRAQRCVMYRRRAASGWGSSAELGEQQPDTGPPGNPDLAAGMGRVFVVWDWCSDAACAEYHMVYRRSNDSGSSWDTAREVGTDALVFSQEYSSSDDVFVRDPYLLHLQPSIALNGDGWPAVVWHADRSSGGMGTDYAIYYSYALAGDVGSVDWEIPPTVLNRGRPSMLGSAVVGVGEPEPGGEQHLHAAYMGELGTDLWEIYYDSNEWDRYQHFYLPVTMRE